MVGGETRRTRSRQHHLYPGFRGDHRSRRAPWAAARCATTLSITQYLGASAIAVETREGWVGYTGDIRFHGAQPGLMEEFAQGFAELRPLALVVDGAHTETGVAPVKESDVYERIKEAISGQDGLIVADFDAMDMERLLTFNAIAEMTGRQLILSLAR